MPGGIIGVNHDDAAGARRDGRLERVKINVPAVIVEERIADEPHIQNVGEKIE